MSARIDSVGDAAPSKRRLKAGLTCSKKVFHAQWGQTLEDRECFAGALSVVKIGEAHEAAPQSLSQVRRSGCAFLGCFEKFDCLFETVVQVRDLSSPEVDPRGQRAIAMRNSR